MDLYGGSAASDFIKWKSLSLFLPMVSYICADHVLGYRVCVCVCVRVRVCSCSFVCLSFVILSCSW